MDKKELAASKIKENQKKWDILSAKLSVLEEQRILENRAEERFRLEHIITETKEERRRLEVELLEIKDNRDEENTVLDPKEEKDIFQIPPRRKVANKHYIIVMSIIVIAIMVLFFLPKSWIFEIYNKNKKQNIISSERIKTDRIRVALVIGNSNYEKYPLSGPAEDIKLVANSLRDVGFRVKIIQDAKKIEIIDAWKYAETVVTYGGVALLYYAGHGLRVNGDDAVVPVDWNEKTGDSGLVTIASLMRNISAFEGKIEGENGELILYSTKPGEMAFDSKDGSPFAKAFSIAVHDTEGDIQKVFRRVSLETQKMTDGLQTPWISGSFAGTINLQDRSADQNLGIVRLIVFDASRP